MFLNGLRPRPAAFESSEPLHLLRLNGVSVLWLAKYVFIRLFVQKLAM